MVICDFCSMQAINNPLASVINPGGSCEAVQEWVCVNTHCNPRFLVGAYMEYVCV